ncbi:MAG: hypothetical protein P4L93_03550 [Coriobacteriia bacterium]|nr:hypothetical protein [Coriobacteriia bacterium]
MPRTAFCSSCNRYVQLSPEGECTEGHPRSALRDVREGSLQSAPDLRTAASTAMPSAELAAIASYDNIFAKLAGKAIIIAPVALILAWGIWSGMAEFGGSGMSWIAKLFWSLFSLLLTVGGAFLYAGLHKRRH